MTLLDELMYNLKEAQSLSLDPNQMTHRGGEYRIGLTRAIDIVMYKKVDIIENYKDSDIDNNTIDLILEWIDKGKPNGISYLREVLILRDEQYKEIAMNKLKM